MNDTRDILRKIRRLELRTRRLVESSFAGQYQSVFKGRGMNFEEVRPYTPGDEIRAIDWNVTARTGEPYIKKFTEEREMTVMIMLDASPSCHFSTVRELKSKLAAELAAPFTVRLDADLAPQPANATAGAVADAIGRGSSDGRGLPSRSRPGWRSS
jgi:uncharacterized protein (DUF58 family)